MKKRVTSKGEDELVPTRMLQGINDPDGRHTKEQKKDLKQTRRLFTLKRGANPRLLRHEVPRNDEGGRLLHKGKGRFVLPGFGRTNMSIIINFEIASARGASQ
jgi:hypothetical protein